MISKVKILVVEDEFIVAEDIRINLDKLDYEVFLTSTGEEAVAQAKTILPDLVLLDVNLGDGMDGVTAAAAIRKLTDIPCIFLTAHSDKATFKRAAETAPHAYIVKPFDVRNLHMAIELALTNFVKKSAAALDEPVGLKNDGTAPSSYIYNDSIFIKFGKAFQKIRFIDICYIKADGSYSEIHTTRRIFTISMNLHTVHERILRSEFFRVHRSYVVNVNCIDRIEETSVTVNKQQIPVNKASREELLKTLNSL